MNVTQLSLEFVQGLIVADRFEERGREPVDHSVHRCGLEPKIESSRAGRCCDAHELSRVHVKRQPGGGENTLNFPVAQSGRHASYRTLRCRGEANVRAPAAHGREAW